MFYYVNVKSVKLRNLALSFGVTVLNIVFCLSRYVLVTSVSTRGIQSLSPFYLGQSLYNRLFEIKPL